MTPITELQNPKVQEPARRKEIVNFINYQTLFLLFMFGSVARFLIEGV